MGYKCLCVPGAVVYHSLSATIGRNSKVAAYYAPRNMEFVYLKNMPRSLLLKYWPLHALADLMLLAAYALRGQTKPFLKPKVDAMRMMPAMLEKRRRIQAVRRVSDQEIEAILTKGWLRDRLSPRVRRVLPPRRGIESSSPSARSPS